MGRLCTICQHPDRQSIDKGLVNGEILRKLALSFDSSEAALFRHKRDHLAPMLTQAKQAEDRAHAHDLNGQAQRQEAASQDHALDIVQQLKAINGASLAILSEARCAQEPETALRAIDRIQKQIDLQARLIGDLDERPVINILLAPEWLSVRAVILDALAGYPAARVAVADRLATLEVGHARD